MASEGMGTNAEDCCHTCGLCLESYDGRTPKILPCFHTFCLPCLTALTENTTKVQQTTKNTTRPKSEQQPEQEAAAAAEDRDDGNENEASEKSKTSEEMPEGKGNVDEKVDQTFACPACRTVVLIPPGGVAELQTNFYLDLAQERSKKPVNDGPLLCEMCEKGQAQDASHFCHNCQQRMCHSCRRLHDRVAGVNEHRVEAVVSKPVSKPTVRAKENKQCQFHPDQNLCFHCCKCDIAICLHCKLTSHEGHETEDMATAALRAKEELSSILNQANKQIHILEAAISRLDRDEIDLKRQEKEVICQINSRQELLMSWASRAHDEVLETIVARGQISLKDIKARKTAASDFKDNISDIVMRASQKSSLGPEIVLLKNELQATLLGDDSFKEYQDLRDRKNHLTFFAYEAESSVFDLDVARIFLGDLKEDNQVAENGSITSMSYQELVATVCKLQADIESLKDHTQNRKVSIHIQMSGNWNCGANSIIVFNKVLCNDGNGYDINTGIFTAPEAGTYVFMATVRNSSNGYCSIVALYVNSCEWGRTCPPESSSIHAAVYLEKGGQIWVQACNNVSCIGNTTMFSGALVSN